MRSRIPSRIAVATIALGIALVAFFSIRQTRQDGTNRLAVRDDRPVTPVSGAVGSRSDSEPILPPLQSLETARLAASAAFKTPITFYGRILDQNDHVVTGADVKYYANDGTSKQAAASVLKSDSDGRFTIGGVTGISLAVQVAKEGYRVYPPADFKVTSSGMFAYAVGTQRHVPSAANPVIFRLQKMGSAEALVAIPEKTFRLHRDGTPLEISLDGRGGHQVILRCWNKDLQRRDGERQYDWRFEISVVEGGLTERANTFDFAAPEGGYRASDLVNMPAVLPPTRWRSFLERSYFIRFNDDLFARISIELHAGGDHFVVWKSYLNPSPTSRNLEAAD